MTSASRGPEGGDGETPVGALRGGPRRSDDVADILCLKLDHIGDLLISAPALTLLRRTFPGARITLICGPWNVALAERMGFADRVVGVSVLDENSVGDLDHDALARRMAAARVQLEALGLGGFDLAVDLTIDNRTRELLKLFPARIYAGLGDPEDHPFLDVCGPAPPAPTMEGPAHVRLAGGDFAAGPTHPVSPAGLRLAKSRAVLSVELQTDQVWSPAELGLADLRMLGAALLEVEVRERATGPAAAEWIRFPLVGPGAEGLVFIDGWADWEPWGRWSRSARATFQLAFPVGARQVTLRCRVQGHTGPQRPEAAVWIAVDDRRVRRDFALNEGPEWIELDLEAPVEPPSARSAPFQLAAGLYAGRLELATDPAGGAASPISLSIQGVRPPRTITRVIVEPPIPASGHCERDFQVRLHDHLEPIVVELRQEGEAGGPPSPAVRGVELRRVEPRDVRTASTHMETRLHDLVGMIVARHGAQALPIRRELAGLLAAPRLGSSAQAARSDLARRRVQGRRLFGIGVGANKSTKLWPPGSMAALCAKLLDRADIDLVLFGGPGDRPAAASLAAGLKDDGRVLDLCGACRIEDLGELLAELDGFIGLDTGPTHFAGRVGVRTLAIFGHAHDPAEWSPVGEEAAWIAADVPCAHCGLSAESQCRFALRCMTLLKPQDVWAAVQSYLLAAPGAA